MRLTEACAPVFARHETFHPKLGWFRKAFVASCADDGGFFLEADAPTRLGVGKNMVRAIRFWGSASRLIVDVDHPSNSRLKISRPTRLGVGLLGPEGLDPYMEDIGTWWLIHWMLLSPVSDLPVWWAMLNEFSAVEFSEDLALRVVEDAIGSSGWSKPNMSSIEKDLSIFVRTYSAGVATKTKFDDQFGSPLRDLGLLAATSDGYRFSATGRGAVPPHIVAAVLLDFLSLTEPGADTASLARLATEPGSPGRILRMSEEELTSSIRAIADLELLTLTAPAGALQLGWRGNPAHVADNLLARHYGKPARSLMGVEGRAPYPGDDLATLLAGQISEVMA